MKEIDPKTTKRARDFHLWIKSPMPMVTVTKTFDVTNLRRVSRKRNIKFNVLMCWCVGKAASDIREFYMLPVGEKLMLYDSIAINIVVNTADGGITNCDVPFSEDIRQFEKDYMSITKKVHESGEWFSLGDDYAIVGTSAITNCEIDSFVNQYSGIWNNPFLMWAKYRKHLFKTTLPISMQFHHAQMDGGDAANFLNALQKEMNKMK